MKKRTLPLIAVMSIGICFTGLSQRAENTLTGSTPVTITTENSHLDSSVLNRTLMEIYDNGPYFDIPGNPDISRLENSTIGNTTLGANVSSVGGYRLSDDFTLTDTYDITGITLYGYQTGAPVSSSPITGVFIQIWDGSPDDPSSSIIFGDTSTNLFSDSYWSNAYRDSETSAGNTDRGIMVVEAAVSGLTLGAGQYWIDYSFEGDANFSGPWGPPISILGATETGDGLQYDPAAGSWTPYLDGGSGFAQGFPFILNGDMIAGVNENASLRDKISIYPNPANNDVTLSNFSNYKLKTAAIYSVTGSLLKTIDLSDMTKSKTIDISSLASGIYMMKINSDAGSVAKQIIKN